MKLFESFHYCDCRINPDSFHFNMTSNAFFDGPKTNENRFFFQKAISDFSIETNHSIVIGNNLSDIIPAINRGVNKRFLLNTNNGNGPMENDRHNIIIVNNWIEIIDDLNNMSL